MLSVSLMQKVSVKFQMLTQEDYKIIKYSNKVG